jgi:hypothetical protein
LPATSRAFSTRFRFASSPKGLRLATDNNSQTHYAKGKQSPGPFDLRPTAHLKPPVSNRSAIRPTAKWARLLHIVCNRFQVYFTPLEGVLFTFPSRYLFTIGCQGVFSLIPWSGRIHAEFHVHRITWDTSRGLRVFAHPAFTVYGRLFHVVTLTVHLPHRGPATPGRQVLPV